MGRIDYETTPVIVGSRVATTTYERTNMSELDLSKPVQVQDECGAWRELPSPRISYEDCNGTRYTLYASACRRLRNTPELEKQAERWRYFNLFGSRMRVRDTGYDQTFVKGNWRDTSFPRRTLGDYTERGVPEITADGNPLQPPPEPRREPYTAETFPMWAVWVRRKTWSAGVREPVDVRLGGIWLRDLADGCRSRADFANLATNYEIAGIDGVWHPASREVGK